MHSQGSDLILIRHAQSTFNQGTLKTMKDLGIEDRGWLQIIQIPQFNQEVTYHERHFDARLTQTGKKQAQSLNEKFTKLKQSEEPHFNILDVDLILVSPYFRALETCRLAFKGTKAKVVVEPLASQIFRYACDVPVHISEKKKQYSEFDFSKVDQLDEDYYLAIFPDNEQQRLKKIFEEEKVETWEHKQNILLKMLAEGSLSEHSHWMRERASKLKDILREHKKIHNKIAVVAHNYTLQFLRCQQFTEDGDLAYPTGILNCHPYYQNLEQLCQKR